MARNRKIEDAAIHTRYCQYQYGTIQKERKSLQSTRTKETIATIIPFSAREMSYGGLTGASPYILTRGNKYLYILYEYNANAILVEPIKNRQASSIATAWQKVHDPLTKYSNKNIYIRH